MTRSPASAAMEPGDTPKPPKLPTSFRLSGSTIESRPSGDSGPPELHHVHPAVRPDRGVARVSRARQRDGIGERRARS